MRLGRAQPFKPIVLHPLLQSGGNISVNITGIFAAGAIASLTPNISDPLSGLTAQALLSAFPAVSDGSSGVTGFGTPASPIVSISYLLGSVFGTGQPGNLAGVSPVGLTAFGQLGSLSYKVDYPLSGVFGQGAVSTSDGVSFQPSTPVAIGRLGSLSYKVDASITGVAGFGIASLPSNFAPTGSAPATGVISSLTPSIAFTLSTAPATAVLGSVNYSIAFSISGVFGQGALALTPSANPNGASSQGVASQLTPQVAKALAGISAFGLAAAGQDSISALISTAFGTGALSQNLFPNQFVFTGVTGYGIAATGLTVVSITPNAAWTVRLVPQTYSVALGAQKYIAYPNPALPT